MSNIQFHGELTKGKLNISVSITVYMWDDNNVTFVYAPSLDLTGYGKSIDEAKESFKIVLEEFLHYTSNKQTLFDDLEQRGWMVNRKKRKVHAPDFEDMLNENEAFKDILLKKEPAKSEVELSLA